jgi:WD40 repeat protein
VLDLTGDTSFEVVVPGYADWMFVDRLGRYVGVIIHKDNPANGTFVTVHMIDVNARKLLPHAFELEARTAYDAVVTPDGRSLLTAAQDQIELWDLATGEKRSHVFQASAAVPVLDVDTDGRLAALGEAGGTIEVVDLETGELVKALEPDVVERFSVVPVFSPDGRWLVASYDSGRVVVWATKSWQEHKGWVDENSLGAGVFTSDSRSLVTTGQGVVSIWNLEQGPSSVVTLEVDPIRLEYVSAGITDDDETVVTLTDSTGVRKWSIAPDRLLDQACMVAGRNLTQQEWREALPDRPYQRTCTQYPAGG